MTYTDVITAQGKYRWKKSELVTENTGFKISDMHSGPALNFQSVVVYRSG